MLSKGIMTAALAGVVVLAVTAPRANAQYYNYYGYYGYMPAPAYYFNPVGDRLRGAAAAQDSYSRNLIATQEARIRFEEWQQARLDTRRKEIEFEMWKRANTPTLS